MTYLYPDTSIGFTWHSQGNAPISTSPASPSFPETQVQYDISQVMGTSTLPGSLGLGERLALPPENFSNLPGAGGLQWAVQPTELTDQDAAVKHGYSPARSSSDSLTSDPAGSGSDTGGGSSSYTPLPGVNPHHGDAIQGTIIKPKRNRLCGAPFFAPFFTILPAMI